MNSGKYDLTEWNTRRVNILQENDAMQRQYDEAASVWQQDAANTILYNENRASGPEIPLTDSPEPPIPYEEPPELPYAFDQSLMPELTEGTSFMDAMHSIDTKVDVMHDFLKEIRRVKYEKDWTRIEAAFNMDEGMRDDDLRMASIRALTDDKSDYEKGRWRLGASLPLVFEACEHIYSRLYLNVRGSGTDYCDVIGREKNDIAGAKRAAAFLNYQYSYEIHTEEELSDWCYDAAKLGTGILCQSWMGNKRSMESISPWYAWLDNARNIEKCSCAIIRRMSTVGELMQLRDQGIVWFTDEDMKTAADASVDHQGPATTYGGYSSKRQVELSMETNPSKDIDPFYKKVAVDTFMDTANKRQIIRVNESLVIAVMPALLPDRLPISILAPRRRGRELYGDSDMIRLLDMQDLINALMEAMVANANASSNPPWIGSDSSLAGQKLTGGYYHYVQDANSVRPLAPASNIQSIFYAIDWIRSNAMDRASGVNDTMRGVAQYAGMTATATRDLSMQAGNRMAPQEKMAINAMKDVNTVALELCQLYLQPHEFFRVVGEQAFPMQGGMPMDMSRPITGEDLIGAVGKDLVPTGSPGTPVGMSQEYLNAATVTMQMGGNPQPIMREYIRMSFDGRINVEDIWPENGIGNDPMQENENVMMGQPISRDPDDNDFNHMNAHAAFQQSKEFAAMSMQNPMAAMAMNMHMQEHMMNLQRQAAMMAGTAMPFGRGSGNGTDGLNTQGIGPDVKTDEEREAQMEAQS